MRIILVLLAFVLMLPVSNLQARTETIAAVVNEDAISMSDVADRLKLIMVSSGLANTAEIRAKLAPQVIGSLIEEQLKFQEAVRLEIAVLPEEIRHGFNAIAQQNNMPADKFRDILQKNGINIATMERQIESQVAWSKVVQQEIRPRISIGDTDIDNVIQRMKNNKGQTEYLVAEIALPVEDPKNENATRQLAKKLVGQINDGQAPFFKIAQQFSKAAGAAQGGDLGWVQQSQLPEDLGMALQVMTKGTISQPIRSLNGYHILFLRDLRTITDETIPSRDQIMSTLGVQRMDRMQRRYLLDLKASAFIENRVSS